MSRKIRSDYFSKDIKEFLFLLARYNVKYVIIGGEAVIYYGYARLTGDIDMFYDRSEENAEKLFQVLNNFWKGDIPGVKGKQELLEKGIIWQFGIPPNRIDLINSIDAVTFKEAWDFKEIAFLQKKPVYFIGLEQLKKNKRAIKRYKDLEDLDYLNNIKTKI